MNRIPILLFRRAAPALLALCFFAAPAAAKTIAEYVPADVQNVAGLNARFLRNYESAGLLRDCLTKRPDTAPTFAWLEAHNLRLFSDAKKKTKANVQRSIFAWKTDKAGKVDFVILLDLTADFSNAKLRESFAKGKKLATTKYQGSTVYTLPTRPVTYLVHMDLDSPRLAIASDLKMIHHAVDVHTGRAKRKATLAGNRRLARAVKGSLKTSFFFLAGVSKAAEAPKEKKKKKPESSDAAVQVGRAPILSYLFRIGPSSRKPPLKNLHISLILDCRRSVDAQSLEDSIRKMKEKYTKRWRFLPAMRDLVSGVAILKTEERVKVSLLVKTKYVDLLLKGLTPKPKKEEKKKEEEKEEADKPPTETKPDKPPTTGG